MLLAGLLLNATLGWGWADPVAGLVIAAVAVREGIEAWKGEGCCAPGSTASHTGEEPGGCGDGCCRSLPVAAARSASDEVGPRPSP